MTSRADEPDRTSRRARHVHPAFTARPQIGALNGADRRWVVDGKHPMGGRGASSVVRKDGQKGRGMVFIEWQAEDVALSLLPDHLAARSGDMDNEGIWAQIIYPNVLGFGGQKSMNIEPELRSTCITIYNDYLAQMQEESNQRLFGMAVLPWWDVKASVKEIERCAKMGLKGVNTNSDPHRAGLPDLGDPHWNPLWEICSDLDLPINFHIGASDDSMSWFGESPWPSLKAGGKLALGSAMMYLSNAKVLGNIIYSGLLDRYLGS